MAPLEYLTAGEARVARKLVDSLLARGWIVSVFDGEDTVLFNSRRRELILAAMGSTGSDTISIRTENTGRVAWFMLVYGNAEDGSELIADYSDNDITEGIYSALGLE